MTETNNYGAFWEWVKEKTRWINPFTYSNLLLKKINPDNHWIIQFPVELLTLCLSLLIFYLLISLVLGTPTSVLIILSESMSPTLHRGDLVLLQGIRSADDVTVQEVSINQNLDGLAFWDFGTVNYYPDASAPPPDTQLCEQRKGQGTYSIKINGEEKRFNTEGDIVVYFSNFPGRQSEPIIHRAVLKIRANDGDYFLTKGDSMYNPFFDEDCGRVVLGKPDCSCISLYPIKTREIQGKAIGSIPLIGYVKLILVDDLGQFLRGCPKTSECPTGCCFP